MDAAQEKQPITNTKEALVAVNETSILLIQATRDGLQPVQDFGGVIAKYQSDPEFKSKVDAAFKDAGKIPAEAKDIDVSEAIEIGMLQLGYVPKIISAFKKVG